MNFLGSWFCNSKEEQEQEHEHLVLYKDMSGSFEKAVRGATKVKLAAPKSKYVEHILLATQSGESAVAEVFRTLTHRLRDSTWTVAFKSLIIVHLMIKEGAKDITLSYLAVSPSHRLAINTFTDVQTQGHNIRSYSEYLLARAKAYEKTSIDYVRSGDGHIRGLSVDKGLLRETEIVQDQIKALLRCTLLDTDENEIALTAFRLLTRDLLDLFTVLNEAVMNVLQRYFELSRPDAERAIKIYRRFCKQTEQVVNYLRTAQQYQHAMRLEIPRIKHAPIDLADTLQEYLDDKDFDIHRRQYLAQQEAKRTGKPVSKPAFNQQKALPSRVGNSTTAPATSSAQPKAPAPDLIDFFESIEQKQQPVSYNAAPYQPSNGFAAQPVQAFPQNGFTAQAMANNFLAGAPQQPMLQQQTGFAAPYNNTTPTSITSPVQYQQSAQIQSAFGQPFTPSPSMQTQPPATALQPQSTNPFRKSILQQPTGSFDSFSPGPGLSTVPAMPQNGNPFGKQTTTAPPMPPYQQPQATGVNPFSHANNLSTPPVVAPIQVQPTGSTNPFRQSMFVNQQTGTGWQHSQQATLGGLEQLPTVPVFPRPGATPSQQNTPGQSPWI